LFSAAAAEWTARETTEVARIASGSRYALWVKAVLIAKTLHKYFWVRAILALIVRRTLATRLILAHTVAAVAPIVTVRIDRARAQVRVGMLDAIVAAPDVDIGRRPAGSQDGNLKGCHATWLIPRDLPLRPSLQVSGWSRIAVAALFAPPVGISLDNTSGDDVAV
jgi:hypothetical protein